MRTSYAPSVSGQGVARNLHVLVVIDREVRAVARARAERRDAEHVGDELIPAAVPREDHRARSGQPLRLLDTPPRWPTGCFSFVLNQPVRPGDPDRVDLGRVAEAEDAAACRRTSSSDSAGRSSPRSGPRARASGSCTPVSVRRSHAFDVFVSLCSRCSEPSAAMAAASVTTVVVEIGGRQRRRRLREHGGARRARSGPAP